MLTADGMTLKCCRYGRIKLDISKAEIVMIDALIGLVGKVFANGP